MNFGQAIDALKRGLTATREGWNGKGMFIYYVPAAEYPASTTVAKTNFGENVPYRAYIAMKTVDNDVAVWTASQSDILADDWSVAECGSVDIEQAA